MENLKLYNQLRSVPEEAKKPINAGRLKGMTDINPVWRIKALTDAFGPCGVGWWYTVDRKEIVRDEITKTAAAFVDVTLHYVDPETGVESRGIPGTGGASFVAQERNGPYMSDECYKMALTDALSVAVKALGLAADVYFARGESKYSAPKDAKLDEVERKMPPVQFVCEECGEVLKPFISPKTGKQVGIREHAEAVRKVCGKVMCRSCYEKYYPQK